MARNFYAAKAIRNRHAQKKKAQEIGSAMAAMIRERFERDYPEAAKRRNGADGLDERLCSFNGGKS